MSQPATGSSFNYADVKQFSKQYLEDRRGILFLCFLLILFGLIVYFQLSCVECSGTDLSGCAASSANASNGDADNGTLNGTATGCLISISILLLVLGVGALAYYMCLIRQSKKLTDAGLPLAAELINGKKGAIPDQSLIAYQTALMEQKAINAGVNPYELIDNPLQNDDEGDDDAQPKGKK